MEISTGLAADLAALTDALGIEAREHDGLEAALHDLGNDVRSAVNSYLGMTVVILIDGQEISFSIGAVALPPTVVCSLVIPLPVLLEGCKGHLALHAATPGALVDLAADLGYCLGSTIQVLDLNVQLPTGAPPIHGLDSFSAINQATGVLMGKGHTAESARTALLTLATEANLDQHHTALKILDTASATPSPACPSLG